MEFSEALEKKLTETTATAVQNLIKEAVDGTWETTEGHRIFTPAHAKGANHKEHLEAAAASAEKRGGKASNARTKRSNGYSEGSAEAAKILRASKTAQEAHVQLAHARDARREKAENYGADMDSRAREHHRGATNAIEDAASELQSRTGVCGPAGYVGHPGGYYA